MENKNEKYFDYKHMVLKNKLGLTNTKSLHLFESEISSVRIAQLREVPIFDDFSMKDFKMIHYYIFQDVYEWAGQYREVNITKGDTTFLPYSFFDNAEQQLNNDIRDMLATSKQSEDAIYRKLAGLLIDLNYMHPFREGNGRTQREFIRQLAEVKGYELNISSDNELYMEACIQDDKVKMDQAIRRNILAKEEKYNKDENRSSAKKRKDDGYER